MLQQRKEKEGLEFPHNLKELFSNRPYQNYTVDTCACTVHLWISQHKTPRKALVRIPLGTAIRVLNI